MKKGKLWQKEERSIPPKQRKERRKAGVREFAVSEQKRRKKPGALARKEKKKDERGEKPATRLKRPAGGEREKRPSPSFPPAGGKRGRGEKKERPEEKD